MKYLNKKDNIRRQRFWYTEKEKTRIKALSRNFNLPPSIRLYYRVKLSKLLPNSSFVRIKNRCKIVCRGKSTYKFFRLNRATIRTFLGSNLLFGIRKSSW